MPNSFFLEKTCYIYDMLYLYMLYRSVEEYELTKVYIDWTDEFQMNMNLTKIYY